MLNYGTNISDKKARDDDECHLIQKLYMINVITKNKI